MKKLSVLLLTVMIAVCFSVTPVMAEEGTAEPMDPAVAAQTEEAEAPAAEKTEPAAESPAAPKAETKSVVKRADPITLDPSKENFANVKVVKMDSDTSYTFKFTITESGGDGYADANGSVTFAKGTAGTKKIPFAAITYTAAGTHTYTLKETNPGNLWKVDAQTKTIKVTVTETDGVLSYTVDTPATITNTYVGDKIKTGIVKKNGNLYYVDPVTKQTRTARGLFKYKGKYYFSKKGGALVTGHTAHWKDGIYRFGDNGVAKTGLYIWTGKKWYADSTGRVREKAGVFKYKGKHYYTKKGGVIVVNKMVTWKGGKYACGEKGVIRTGIFKWKGKYYYAFQKGKMRTKKGVFTYNGKRYYTYKNAQLAINKRVHYKGYDFICGPKSTKGAIKTGMFTFKGKKYYANAKGHLRTDRGIFTYGGKKYYTYSGGQIATNARVSWNGSDYLCGDSGVILTGINTWKGRNYYSDSQGRIRTTPGMFTYNGHTYCVSTRGALVFNDFYYKTATKLYYFGSNGRLVKSAFTYGGVRFHPNSSSGRITDYAGYKIAMSGYANKYSEFVLVDISEQQLYYFDEKNVELNFSVITGDVASGSDTPTGVFSVKTKETATTVNEGDLGERDVNYWMAFKGSTYGIHDASWRSEFGGSIYKKNGTPGCINCKNGNMKKLYNMVDLGTIFIVCN